MQTAVYFFDCSHGISCRGIREACLKLGASLPALPPGKAYASSEIPLYSDIPAPEALLSIRAQDLLKSILQIYHKTLSELSVPTASGSADCRESFSDLLEAVLCYDSLPEAQAVFSPLTACHGVLECPDCSSLFLPFPEVVSIAASAALPVQLTDDSVRKARITPLGAAFAAALYHPCTLPEHFTILSCGYGSLQTSVFDSQLRILRLLPSSSASVSVLAAKDRFAASACDPVTKTNLSEASPAKKGTSSVLLLQTNIDDSTGESLSFAMSLLLEAGALDVFYTPIYMKKNRPACLFSVLCRPGDRQSMERILFQNTSTIGIRAQLLERTCLKREILSLETPYGTAEVKCCTYENEIYCYPENDSVCRLARLHRIGFPTMYQKIQTYAQTHIEKGNAK